MKNLIAMLFAALSLTACVSQDYEVGTDREVTVGSAMIQQTRFVYGSGNFYNTLIYTGKEGTTVFIQHSLSSDRGANRNTDYRFDMARSDVFTVQTVRIQVLSYTPDSIRFKVLQTDMKTRIDHSQPTTYKVGDIIELKRTVV